MVGNHVSHANNRTKRWAPPASFKNHTPHNELINSLQEYFDDALFNILLYDGEAEMYQLHSRNVYVS
jgi:hypothetical protein